MNALLTLSLLTLWNINASAIRECKFGMRTNVRMAKLDRHMRGGVARVAIIISGFQQKYVVWKAMRRSGGISKNLLIKKLKSKVYVSFRISLYIIFFFVKTQN